MNETPIKTAEPVTVDEIVKASLGSVRQRIHNRREKCEERIKSSPTASVLGALGIGYLLHRMPVRAILVTQVRILSALAPPALFLFGAAKLLSSLQREQAADRK